MRSPSRYRRQATGQIAARHTERVTIASRGQCSVCLFRFRLRKDGTLMRHAIYSGNEGRTCEGSGKWPHATDPAECGACMAYAASRPHLAGAAASVGISYGKSTAQMLREYFASFHERGHEEGA